MLRIIENASESKGNGLFADLDELAREGARRMLVSALDAEVTEYVERYRIERDGEGRALVVRNGKARPRKVTLGAGTVTVTAPRVHDRRMRAQFTSKILPPYMRRSPKVAEERTLRALTFMIAQVLPSSRENSLSHTDAPNHGLRIVSLGKYER